MIPDASQTPASGDLSASIPEMSDEPDLAIVIMAGGAGTRFWPLSTHARPKQFLRLLSERTLLQESFARARLLAPPDRILVLTGADYVGEVRRELPELPAANVVGEPMRRDTAAPVALGALLLRERFGNPVMVVLTADHRIEPPEAFRRDLLSAAAGAAADPVLYTLGIPPDRPATGYGYLELGDEVPAPAGGPRHHRLRRFREKPDRETAEAFLAAGGYLWNSGMFVWATGTILDEYERLLPGHLKILRPAATALAHVATPADATTTDSTADLDATAVLRRAFADLPAVSVDYGIMEHAREVRTLEASFAWDDLGGWPSLAGFLPSDGQGNRYRGRLVAYEAGSNVVFSDDPEELVALLGVRDLVVVRAGARTLVVPRSRSEDIKRLVAELDRRGEGGNP